MAQKWATGGTTKAHTSKAYTKGFAGGGFIEGLASGISAGYGSGSRKADADANKPATPSKMAIRFDDGTTIADNLRSGAKKLKTSLFGDGTAASSTSTDKPET